jgi:hypothetical protein
VSRLGATGEAGALTEEERSRPGCTSEPVWFTRTLLFQDLCLRNIHGRHEFIFDFLSYAQVKNFLECSMLI